MSKFFKTVLLGGLTGAAVAYLLTSKEGKALQEKAKTLVTDYQEDPDAYHQLVKDKVEHYGQEVVDGLNSYHRQWQEGKLTKEDCLSLMKETSSQVLDATKEKVNQVKDSLVATDNSPEQEEKLPEVGGYIDDIVIDYDDLEQHKK